MKTKIAILLFSLLAFACTDRDGSFVTEVCVKNNSLYDIEIICAPHLIAESIFPERLTVANGETFIHRFSEEGGFNGLPTFNGVVIVFDGVVYTYHKAYNDAYHNFCVENSYEVKQVDKRHKRYTFTFTDEDYEYALANPAPDDVIKEIEL